MTNPELEDEPVGIIREVEAYRSTTARRRSTRPSHSYGSLTWRNYACQLGNRRIGIRGVEMPGVLLIHVPAISRANAPPACRKDSDTANGIYRVVVEGIRRPAARVHRRTRFADQLEVFVDRVVKSQS